ncbi:hypothetical protein BH23ACT10_BH23ACT10_17390 [soil metagenome]
MNATRWRRLRAHLDDLGASDLGSDADRVGAVLALLVERDDDLEFVLTRRRDDLSTHPGQISFPGGRREDHEATVVAALREAAEEVGLRGDTVDVLGQLPAFFIGPSRYWMVPVVARWRDPHPLRAQESEVAAIVRAPVTVLVDRARWRKVRLSVSGWSLAWLLDDDHVLWGATAMVVNLLLDVLEPGWRAGVVPADLPDDREVRPWLDPRLRSRAVPPRLADVPARARSGVAAPRPADEPGPSPQRVDAAGAAVARAVGLLRSAPEQVVVLAGPGGTGAVGVAAARHLADAGVQVTTITSTGGLVDGMATEAFDACVPPADCYVDALVGAGLDGRLRDAPLDMMLALRNHSEAILAVDLPSGLHRTDGLIGDLVPATVTIALEGMWPALAYVGLAPFVGDLYLWQPGDDGIVRLVGGPDRTTTDGGWRE